MISLLAYPFLACLVLVLIHVYFGSFVLKRGIIFIDLALAQWAALGYLVGHGLHIESPIILFLIGFGFTVIAALILIILKPIFDRVNLQEAVIGVVYIAATTVAVIIISTTGMEGHHLNEMLSGHLLFVQPYEVMTAYTIYGLVAGILFWAHKYFLQGQSRIWDFLFYILFGLVVTSSVQMVGILLVFSFLVLPILSLSIYDLSFKKEIKYAWGIGIFASILGLICSVIVDIPLSYTIIMVLIGIWIASIGNKILIK